ncbi:sporulation integral membrane protein YtvI [Lederbergia graminis]|uniref:Sporulation integral membrane protein YtvI n=1 Tax=Lederbergia graminis TaxID=735518 RepID=A0ABW0LF53_9BACI
MNRETVNIVIRFLLVLSIIFLLCISLYFISKVTYPFIIAIAITIMINPAVNFLEFKWKFPRALAVLSTLFILIAIFAGIITLLIAEIVAGASYLATVVPHHVGTFILFLEDWFAGQVLPFYNKISNLFQSLDSGQQETIMDSIRSAGNKITETATVFLQSFFLNLPGLISWIPNAATVLVFSVLATFFISKDWRKLTALFKQLLPEKAHSSGKKVFVDLKKAFAGFFKAQFTLISITLMIVLIGLLILKIQYAITIAFISALVDLLPYLGTGIVFVPWIIYEAVTGNYGLALGLGILYTVVVVQRQVMEPKILSTNIGLNPLATLIALFVGFKLFGFLGLIAGPVLLVFISALHNANVFYDIWEYIIGNNKNA